jgi:DnaD/phage-associated family protein
MCLNILQQSVLTTIVEFLLSSILFVRGSLVVEAMKKASEQGKQYWGYVEAILVKWEQLGVKDVKDAQSKESEFMSQKPVKGKGQKRQPVRTEKLPDWFKGEQQTESQVQEHDEEFEAEKAKLMAELKEYRERGSYISMHG